MTVLQVPPFDPNGVIAATSGISHWSPWVFVSASGLGVVFLIADRVLKPWHARRLAEAREREALALLTSEQMQAGLKILVGEKANPDQGIEERLGVGRRLSDLEALFRNGVHAKLDVLMALIDENQTIITDHITAADQTRSDLANRIDSLAGDVAESRDQASRAATLAGEAATTVSREVQTLKTEVASLHQRFDDEVLPTRQENEALRASLTEVLHDSDPPPQQPPAA